MLFAFQQLGKPYIWGGNGPVGYDCSGLALASWQHGAGVELRPGGRRPVPHGRDPGADDRAPHRGPGVLGIHASDWTSVYHTALYVGGNRIVEATGDHVQLNQLGQWGTGDLMPNARRP